LLLHVKERGRFFFKSSTELGNGEGSASATGRLRNVFGGAETLEANVSFGTKTKQSFTATFTAPFASTDLRTKAEVTAFGWHRDNEAWASSHEELEGLRTAIRVRSVVIILPRDDTYFVDSTKLGSGITNLRTRLHKDISAISCPPLP